MENCKSPMMYRNREKYTSRNDIVAAFSANATSFRNEKTTFIKVDTKQQTTFSCKSNIRHLKVTTLLGGVKYTSYDVSSSASSDNIHHILVELAWMRSIFVKSSSFHEQTLYLAYEFVRIAFPVNVDSLTRRKFSCVCILLASKIEDVEIITLDFLINECADMYIIDKTEFEATERFICSHLQWNLSFLLTPYVYISFLCHFKHSLIL